MKRVWQFARPMLQRDLDTVTRGRFGVLLLLLIPAALFLTIESQPGDRKVRLLIAGSASDPKVTGRLLYVLRESSQLEVLTPLRNAVTDPFAKVKRDRVDILLNYEGAERHRSMYCAETDPRRLAELERIAAGIARAEVAITRRVRNELAAADRERDWPLAAENWWARPDLYEDLFMLGPLPVNALAEYFPQAADPSVVWLPTFVLLTITLLPFVLVIGLREDQFVVERWTWPEIALRFSVGTVVPAAVTLFEVMGILLVAEWAMGVHVKAGTIRMAMLVFLAAMASACAGLMVSGMSRNRTESAICSLMYILLAVLLTSGPLTHRGPVPVVIAQLLPSTHLRPVFTAWLFGAPYDTDSLLAAGYLAMLASSFWISAVSLARHAAARNSKHCA